MTEEKTTAGKAQLSSAKTKARFGGATPQLDGHIFYYGSGMNTKCMTSKEKLLEYVGTKYSASEKLSLTVGKVTIVGVREPKDISKDDYEKMKFKDQKKWDQAVKRYSEAEARIETNLSACYTIIWGQMTRPLQNRIKAHPEYADMRNTHDAIALLNLVVTICNTATTIDHYESRLVDCIYSILTFSGDKMTLGEYYEHFQERIRLAEPHGVDFATEMLKNHVMKDIPFVAKKTLTRQNNPEDDDDQASRYDKDSRELQHEEDEERIEYLEQIRYYANQRIYALIYLRQSGERFEELRRELQNDYLKGTDHMPRTIDDANALLETYQGSDKYVQAQIKKNSSRKSVSFNQDFQ